MTHAVERHLDWAGCFNVRDLGGLPAAGGLSSEDVEALRERLLR